MFPVRPSADATAGTPPPPDASGRPRRSGASTGIRALMLALVLVVTPIMVLSAPAAQATPLGPTVCVLHRDRLDRSRAQRKTFPAPEKQINGRRLVLHVSDPDGMAWGSIDNGITGDSVWRNRSWDGGATWEELLGKASIPGTWAGTRTLMYNLTDPALHHRGMIRACGDARGTDCTDWVYPTVMRRPLRPHRHHLGRHHPAVAQRGRPAAGPGAFLARHHARPHQPLPAPRRQPGPYRRRRRREPGPAEGRHDVHRAAWSGRPGLLLPRIARLPRPLPTPLRVPCPARPFRQHRCVRRDATFCAQPGAAGGSVRLASINELGTNVRHYADEVWVASSGGQHTYDTPDMCAEDTSWAVEAPGGRRKPPIGSDPPGVTAPLPAATLAPSPRHAPSNNDGKRSFEHDHRPT